MSRTILIGFALMLVAGCAHQPPSSDWGADVPGFFSGVVHGFLVLPALIGSLFMDIRIYAFPNSGSGYDWGYMLGMTLNGVLLASGR